MPVNIIAGMDNQLFKENPLRPSIPLSKGIGIYTSGRRLKSNSR
ncbi:hypothetical protein [Candidatus Sodalis sp. SoCistrobi]|nr:hypothetical protein [Candidatus Sodalis sp. SoCistrobi]